MTILILDSGAVTALAHRNRQAFSDLRLAVTEESWSTVVPSLVLVECLAGHQRADAVVNRFSRNAKCLTAPPETGSSRRRDSGQGRPGSAVDAVAVANGRTWWGCTDTRRQGPDRTGRTRAGSASSA